MRYKTKIEHWSYHDGWKDIPHILRTIDDGAEIEFHKDLVGWHCWVYAADNDEFSKWMQDNMIGEYECDFRFNSGDPMHTVFIREDQDATLFKIKWM